MKLITVIFDDIQLLKPFLFHYSKLGATQFFIGVYEDQRLIPLVKEMCADYEHRIIPIAGRYDGRKDTSFRHDTARQFVNAHEWWVVADLDEFHEYPKSLPDLLPELDHTGCSYLLSGFLDRITADGTSPLLRSDLPLWQQFPAAANVTAWLTQSTSAKMMLVKGWERTSAGHHKREGGSTGRIRRGGVVHHFKWHGNILERIRRKRDDIVLRNQRHYKRCDRFIAFWEERGRLPVRGEFKFHFPPKPPNWPELPLPVQSMNPQGFGAPSEPGSGPAGPCEDISLGEGLRNTAAHADNHSSMRNLDVYNYFARHRRNLCNVKFLESFIARRPRKGDITDY